MKKTYLILTPMYPSERSFRGPFIHDQAAAIRRSGRYDVVVMKAVPFGQDASDYDYDGIHVLCFHDAIPSSGAFAKELWPVSAVNMEAKLLSEGISLDGIAVCHAETPSLVLLGQYLKRRDPRLVTAVQFHMRGVGTKGRLSSIPFLERYVLGNSAWLSNLPDLRICVSDHVRETLRCEGVGEKLECYTLYNGVDPGKFHPVAGEAGAMRRKADGERRAFRIGCVANFIPQKNQLSLIRSVQRLVEGGMDDLALDLVGSGPTKAECVEYVGRTPSLAKRVRFLGEMDHRRLREFYGSLDLFVLTSRNEALGCVYLEAHASGVPFIGSRGEGIEEFVAAEDVDKWLAWPGDEACLAQRIAGFRRNGGRQRLRFPVDIDWHVGRYLDFLEDRFFRNPSSPDGAAGCPEG